MNVFRVSFCCIARCIPMEVNAASYKAFVCVPIADLVGGQFRTQEYLSMPLSGYEKPYYKGCPRLFQAIFNQPVNVIHEQHDQVMIALNNAFYKGLATQLPTRFGHTKTTFSPSKNLSKQVLTRHIFLRHHFIGLVNQTSKHTSSCFFHFLMRTVSKHFLQEHDLYWQKPT